MDNHKIKAVVIFNDDHQYNIELPADMVQGNCKEWLRTQLNDIYRHLHSSACRVCFTDEMTEPVSTNQLTLNY